MARVALMSLAALLLLGGSVIKAQTTHTRTTTAEPVQVGSASPNIGDLCVLPNHEMATVKFNSPGLRTIRLDIRSGYDCNPENHWTWSLIAAAPAPFGEDTGDAVEEQSCPVLKAQMDKLGDGRQPASHQPSGSLGVRAGEFIIADRSGLFDLETRQERNSAARWIRETLSAVRPCWNNFRQDPTHKVVDRVYAFER